MPGHIDELKDIVVVDVKVKNYCSVFVLTTSAELFVEAAINLSKRARTTCNKPLAIIASSRP
jgi:hypothetical protein